MSEEYSGQKSVVIRHRVSHSRFGDDLPDTDTSNLDFGQPSTLETFTQMQELAEKLANSFTEENNSQEDYEETLLKQIAQFANKEFPFREQGTGIGTFPKLLDNYEHISKDELPNHLDCKLATVMTGLMVQEVAKKKGLEVKLSIGSKDLLYNRVTAHPTLLIDFVNKPSNRIFVVDFHLHYKTGESEPKIRPLTKEGLVAIATGRTKSIALNTEALNALDRVFLRD